MTTPLETLRGIRGQDDSHGEQWDRLEALARDMAASGRARDDPVRAVFGLLGDRWSMLILLALGAGAWRQATLKRVIGALAIEGAISQRMLTLKLRALERDGFLARDIEPTVPPRVTYRLTALGEELLDAASRLLDWIRAARLRVEGARARFDARDD